MSSFEPSLVRQALDVLLDRHPHLDLLDVNWRLNVGSPWVTVMLGQPSQGEAEAWAVWEVAIWKRTGAVHSMSRGEVLDPAIWEP